jgi:hypothetical protein
MIMTGGSTISVAKHNRGVGVQHWSSISWSNGLILGTTAAYKSNGSTAYLGWSHRIQENKLLLFMRYMEHVQHLKR